MSVPETPRTLEHLFVRRYGWMVTPRETEKEKIAQQWAQALN
jgi:hypothetical protein